MRIIKQGRPKATKNILRFRCCRCGCEFEADDTEYKQASQIAYVHGGIIATCICPCCGFIVYNYVRERRSKVMKEKLISQPISAEINKLNAKIRRNKRLHSILAFTADHHEDY